MLPLIWPSLLSANVAFYTRRVDYSRPCCLSRETFVLTQNVLFHTRCWLLEEISGTFAFRWTAVFYLNLVFHRYCLLFDVNCHFVVWAIVFVGNCCFLVCKMLLFGVKNFFCCKSLLFGVKCCFFTAVQSEHDILSSRKLLLSGVSLFFWFRNWFAGKSDCFS